MEENGPFEQNRNPFRNSPVEITPEAFRELGYLLVDRIADFLKELPDRLITAGEDPAEVRTLIGSSAIPDKGTPMPDLVNEACNLLFDHSLFNGHPRFWGYITSSAAPIGALADMLAATVNANVGAYILSPAATEIEKLTIQWLSALIGYHKECGGLFVSGGNMANFTGYLTAKFAKTTDHNSSKVHDTADHHPFLTDKKVSQYTVYCSEGTHTWIEKASKLFGSNRDLIRWIDQDDNYRMNCHHLENKILEDQKAGFIPFMVVGNAGSVSLGTVDNLSEISRICRMYDLWFHIDGAYGVPAASLKENDSLFMGLKDADSIALDPHKWLYSALEAGCILIRDPKKLKDTFSFHPSYYNFDGDTEDEPTNFHEFGLQNSRGFRALKVWMAIRQVGASGYQEMIREDIRLARMFYDMARKKSKIQLFTCFLSIVTFRYVPDHILSRKNNEYINELNEKLLNRLQSGGQVFLSNALIKGNYCLRMCIVNFRTQETDLKVLLDLVLDEGQKLDRLMRKP